MLKKFLFVVLFSVVACALFGVSGSSRAGAARCYGKIRIVSVGEDFKVKLVSVGEDLRVKEQKFASRCGQWEIVSVGEDFKVRFVSVGEDFKVRFVSVDEGLSL